MKAKELFELVRHLDGEADVHVQLPLGQLLPVTGLEQRQSMQLRPSGAIVRTDPVTVLTLGANFPPLPVASMRDDQIDVTSPAGFKKVAEIMRDVFQPGDGGEGWRGPSDE